MEFEIRVVSGNEIRAHLHPGDAVDIVERAFAGMTEGRIDLSPKHHWELRAGQAAAFASHDVSSPLMAIKINTVRPRDDSAGIPSDISQIVVHDAGTGAPRALLDGTAITALRTGAAAALGARLLARPGSRVATLVGPGAAGLASVRALAASMTLDRIHIAGSRAAQRRWLVQSVGQVDCEVLPTDDVEACIRESDIVITATPSAVPVVADDWLQPGTHISAVGSDWTGKQELETATLRRARLFTDLRAQCLEIGELNVPYSRGDLGPEAIDGEIGEVILGLIPGRTDEAQITVFDSSGVAAQDSSTAGWALDAAERAGIGLLARL